MDFTLIEAALDVDIRLDLGNNPGMMKKVEKKGLPREEALRVVRLFFEKTILAINQQIVTLGDIA